MQNLLGNVFQKSRSVSAGQLQTELSIFQQDLSSGFVEVGYAGGEQYYLFYNEGQLFNFYRVTNGVVSVVDASQPSLIFGGKGDASLRTCSVAPRFFRALRVALFHQLVGEKRSSTTDDLMKLISSLQQEKTPLLLQADWPSASGFVFIPGNNSPSREFLFITENQLHGTNVGVTILSRWPEKDCNVTLYRSSSDMDIWREVFITLGFSIVFEKMISRYDELVGRSLVSRLETNLNGVSRSQSLNISFANKGMDDVHTFLSISDASAAYRQIFKAAVRQMSTVVGPKLVSMALEDGVLVVPPIIQQMLSERRIFEL